MTRPSLSHPSVQIVPPTSSWVIQSEELRTRKAIDISVCHPPNIIPTHRLLPSATSRLSFGEARGAVSSASPAGRLKYIRVKLPPSTYCGITPALKAWRRYFGEIFDMPGIAAANHRNQHGDTKAAEPVSAQDRAGAVSCLFLTPLVPRRHLSRAGGNLSRAVRRAS